MLDRKVDNIIYKAGFKNCEIFYSPIGVWLAGWIILFVLGGFSIVDILNNYFSDFLSRKVITWLLIYAGICYLIIVLFNRSFALTDKELLVVNSHFPFRKIDRFNLKGITEVKISTDRRLKYLMIFGLFHSHYIEVKTKFQKKRFYCLFLDFDCHDENWTEKNLDDLEDSLKLKGVNTKLLF